MEIILKILPYVLNIFSGVILALATRSATKAKEAREKETEKNQKLADGVQVLLRAQIVEQYNKARDRGYCPIYAKETVEKAYTAYHALGGNGTITSIYENIMELPTEAAEKEAS